MDYPILGIESDSIDIEKLNQDLITKLSHNSFELPPDREYSGKLLFNGYENYYFIDIPKLKKNITYFKKMPKDADCTLISFIDKRIILIELKKSSNSGSALQQLISSKKWIEHILWGLKKSKKNILAKEDFTEYEVILVKSLIDRSSKKGLNMEPIFESNYNLFIFYGNTINVDKLISAKLGKKAEGKCF